MAQQLVPLRWRRSTLRVPVLAGVKIEAEGCMSAGAAGQGRHQAAVRVHCMCARSGWLRPVGRVQGLLDEEDTKPMDQLTSIPMSVGLAQRLVVHTQDLHRSICIYSQTVWGQVRGLHGRLPVSLRTLLPGCPARNPSTCTCQSAYSPRLGASAAEMPRLSSQLCSWYTCMPVQ